MAVEMHWVESKHKEAQSEFNLFVESREVYNNLTHRYAKPVTDPRLGNVATGADYRTPDLMEAEQDVSDVLGKSPPRFDAIPGKTGPAAQGEANDVALWAARMNNILDEGGWWSRRLSGGQFRHGAKVTRLLCDYPQEPGKESTRDREEYMKNAPPSFSLQDVDTLACSWLTNGNELEVIFWDYEVPVLAAEDMFKLDGSQLGEGYTKGKKYTPIADRVKKSKSGLVWIGDDERVGQASTWTQKLHVTVCEYRDYKTTCTVCADKHPMWSGVEIVRGAGKALGDGEIVSEYTLPFKYEPTLRLTVARESIDREPHFRYAAFGHPLFVEAATVNWCETVLMQLANKDSSWENIYADIGRMPDEVARRVPENVWQSMSIDIDETTTRMGKVPLLPTLAVWPTNNLESTFLEMKRDALQRFENKKPNRYLLGAAFDEASKATGSAYISSVQQAALPYDNLAKQQDKTRKRVMMDILHAIKYMEQSRPPKAPEWKYYVTIQGGEPLKRGSAEAGKQLYMSASRLSTNPELTLFTQSETLTEQAERQRQALERWQTGFADDEQTMEELGYYDTEGQKERITKQRIRRRNQPTMEALQDNILRLILPVLVDVDPSLLPQAPVPPAGQQPVSGDQAVGGPSIPNVRLPAGTSGVGSNTGGPL